MEGHWPPEEWLISRICEEFGCLPSQAVEEFEDGPTQLVLDVMTLRAYAQAKVAVEQGGDLPATPMVRKVMQIREELDRMQAEGQV